MSNWPGLSHDKALFVHEGRLCEDTAKYLYPVPGKSRCGPHIASLLGEDSKGPKGKEASEDGEEAEENFSVNKIHCTC